MRFYQVFFAFLAHFVIDALRFRNTAGILAVEARLARTVDFHGIIELFASGKARRVSLV